MMTAKGEEIDRVVGFELGADDYVVKPFSVRELLLRVQAILRRSQGEQEAAAGFQFGKLRVDRELTVSGRKTRSSSSQRSSSSCWSRSTTAATGCKRARLSSATSGGSTRTSRPAPVDTHVKRLREKLGEAGNYIETVRGVGYRFTDTPEEVASSTA